VLVEVISSNKGMIWVCACETSHNLRVLAVVSRARCCKKPQVAKTELTASIQTKGSELAAKHKDSLGELKAECDKLLC
jgi:hypothetical protein